MEGHQSTDSHPSPPPPPRGSGDKSQEKGAREESRAWEKRVGHTTSRPEHAFLGSSPSTVLGTYKEGVTWVNFSVTGAAPPPRAGPEAIAQGLLPALLDASPQSLHRRTSAPANLTAIT